MGHRVGVSKKKFSRKYFDYNRVDHKSSKCKKPKKKWRTNLTEGQDMDLYIMVSEVNQKGSNTR